MSCAAPDFDAPKGSPASSYFSQDSIIKLATYIGFISLSFFVAKVLKFIHIFTRSSSISRYNHASSKGAPWAIITGASDGIGKAYANLLAAEGFNIIIHGRNPSKLQTVQRDLQTAFPKLQFRTFVSNASATGPDVLKQIKDFADSLKELHVTILINNVGSGEKLTGPLLQTFRQDTPEDIDGLLNLNARFLIQFTSAILPSLLSHQKPALILTMGSMAACGMPYLSIYAGCKSFDLTFSTALRREMIAEGKDVEVLGIMVGEVTDVAWDRTGGTFMRPRSGDYAKRVLQKVGCGEDVIAAWWSHGLLWWALEFFPSGLLRKIFTNGILEEKKRQDGLKKRE